ncbi:uncharacterized protein DUF1419 [Mesorhizobium sp. J18]|uniref:DUF1419 domain-containing protein n=1 Tax=Mesorhizobium sp. J18 TaxID=935263 RepID=UPI0011993712|nr:DUF1419 domain-containing protein [Mesorhizobium sp. J18]TWG94231.1 uncharacterized protein DUF1419 [Mesorhizobium sp. J18]
MTLSAGIRKVFQGVADRRQMFRMFDRHAQRPNRWANHHSALSRGEWFEIAQAEHDHMFEILPPLWMILLFFIMASRTEFLTLPYKLVGNLQTYLIQNKTSMVDYCHRYWSGQPISSSPAESAANSLVNARMNKKRQMRWSPVAAHRVLQVRAAVADVGSSKSSLILQLDPHPFPVPSAHQASCAAHALFQINCKRDRHSVCLRQRPSAWIC